MLQKPSRAAALLLFAAVPLACDFGTDPDPVPTTVQLTSSVDELAVGATTNLSVTVLDQNGSTMPNAEVTFSSSNDGRATVSQLGVVTGVGVGSVTITATAGAASDNVTLTIFVAEDPCTIAFEIQVGESVNGTLEPGDCDQIVDDNSFVDIWFFDMESSGNVTIDLISTDFDAYLFFLDNDFNTLAQDDDSGTGTNARVVTATDTEAGVLTAGTYWILANHWPDSGDGDYTLSVTAAGSGSDPGGEPVEVTATRVSVPAGLRGKLVRR